MKNDRLIPYSVIIAAKKGDPDAMRQILQHYDPYIDACSRRRFYDEYDTPYTLVDEDIKNRIQAKLMFQIIYDFDPYKPPVARNENLHKK